MPDTYQISIAAPYPGTEFYQWLKDNNYLITERFEDWLDEDGQQRCVISYPNLSKEEMEAAVRRALVEYYFSPRFLFKTFKVVIRDWKEFKRYVIAATGFLRQLYRWYLLREK